MSQSRDQSRSKLRAGGRPERVRVSGVLCGSTALLVSFMLGGCSTGSALKTADFYPLQPPGSTVVWPTSVSAVPVADVERGGIEGQRPSERRTSEIPSDPAAPSGPSFGSVPPADGSGQKRA